MVLCWTLFVVLEVQHHWGSNPPETCSLLVGHLTYISMPFHDVGPRCKSRVNLAEQIPPSHAILHES